MLRSILLGVLAGARSMTPIAVVGAAAQAGRLPDGALAGLLAHPAVASGLKALAVGEILGDKWRHAPDRIVPAGMAARLVAAAAAGWAVAPSRGRGLSALLAAATALGSAHLTFRARLWGMRRHGQASTGLVEDLLVFAATQWVVQGASRRRK